MQFNSKQVFHGTLVGGLLLASSAIVLEAQAAEQITLSYQGSEVDVTRSELDSFTETGELPDSIQNLLGTEVEVPTTIRTLLNREIKIPNFIEEFLESATGEFVLGQLDDTISDASGRTERDLFDLKTAFKNAAKDQELSFMEIVRQYPQKNVRVNLTNLESTYNRVSNFVERVQPALEVAKGFLSDIICDCNTASAMPDATDASYASTEKSAYSKDEKPCKNSNVANIAVRDQESE